jgi:hypothetical protein
MPSGRYAQKILLERKIYLKMAKQHIKECQHATRFSWMKLEKIFPQKHHKQYYNIKYQI